MLEGINSTIVSVSQSSLLTVGISSFNATLYSYVQSIMTSVIMPVAYVILALFLGLQLYHISDQSFEQSGTTSVPLRLLFKLGIKISVAKLAVDNALTITEALYDASLEITTGIAGIFSGGTAGGLDTSALVTAVESMGFWDHLVLLLVLFLVSLVVKLGVSITQVICVGRFIELYIMTALAPVPLATLLTDELGDVGKNFLKSFAASCLQGAILYFVISCFPLLLNSQIMATNDPTAFGMAFDIAMYAVVLLLAVFSAGRISKSILHAS